MLKEEGEEEIRRIDLQNLALGENLTLIVYNYNPKNYGTRSWDKNRLMKKIPLGFSPTKFQGVSTIWIFTWVSKVVFINHW